MRRYFALLLVTAALPAPAFAQSAPDVADLAGARAASGETQLLARGYVSRHSTTVGEQRYTFWWNQRLGRCLSVSTVDGRYGALIAVPAENCDNGPPRDAYAPQQHAYDRPAETGYRDPNSLVLVCYGAGTRPTVTSKPTYKWNPWNHKWEWSTEVGNSVRRVSPATSRSNSMAIRAASIWGQSSSRRSTAATITAGGTSIIWSSPPTVSPQVTGSTASTSRN